MDEKTQNATVRAMNDELLKTEDSDEKPKRNSKEFLIARIWRTRTTWS